MVVSCLSSLSSVNPCPAFRSLFVRMRVETRSLNKRRISHTFLGKKFEKSLKISFVICVCLIKLQAPQATSVTKGFQVYDSFSRWFAKGKTEIDRSAQQEQDGMTFRPHVQRPYNIQYRGPPKKTQRPSIAVASAPSIRWCRRSGLKRGPSIKGWALLKAGHMPYPRIRTMCSTSRTNALCGGLSCPAKTWNYAAMT